MHVKIGALGIKMVENRCESRKIFSYGGPCGISFQIGVRGLISVNFGVLDMKKFENPCFREGSSSFPVLADLSVFSTIFPEIAQMLSYISDVPQYR